MRGEFDGQGFYEALDAQRLSRGLNWKKVAEESGVSASTLTRIAQGKRPDVDSFAALLSWCGLDAGMFIRHKTGGPGEAEPLTKVTVLLRADRNLSREGATALEALVKAAYERLRED
jgi:transcriptional regulator with XRE-family HTH domain